MTWDKKDRALIKASSLSGYCRSAPDMLTAELSDRKSWVDGLLEYAQATEIAIDDVFNEETSVK